MMAGQAAGMSPPRMLLLAASLLLCLGTGTGSGSGSSAASSSASATDDLALALAAVRTLTSRVEQLERRVHTLESESSSPPCGVAGAGFPTLPEGAEYAYSGCTRNVERLAVNSTTMCQSGTVKIYDTQTTNTTGPRCHTARAVPVLSLVLTPRAGGHPEQACSRCGSTRTTSCTTSTSTTSCARSRGSRRWWPTAR
jgi:hypothetical protein